MGEKQNLRNLWKKTPVAMICVILVLVVMLLLLRSNIANSWQSMPAIFPEARFEGQYRIGDGPWQTIVEGSHIPSTKGDVTLQGNFHLYFSDGEYLGQAEAGTPLAFYVNHIGVTVHEEGQPPYALDTENERAGEGLCGVFCEVYQLTTGETVTLVLHNPHRFGNENAIDEFLDELSVYGDAAFEKQFAAKGNAERNVGLVIMIAALALLGTALFSALLRMEDGGKLWTIGLCMVFAGGYFAFGAKGVAYWSDSIIGNTTILGLCMILYMLNICVLIVSMLNRKLRKIGNAVVIGLAAGCLAIGLICLLTDVRFYDTWLWWTWLQSAANAALLVCLALNFKGASGSKIAGNTGAIVVLLGYEADVVGTAFGWWQGGLICRCVFMVLFAAALVMVWQIIPRNSNAARKAKEMEAEQKTIRAQLQEQRIAIMISQIQPHFIYNTLGTIQHLCKEDPDQAANLVRNFSVYLRGNFSELDNTVPSRFLKELEHVRCYTEIELIRFPDMTVNYDIQTEKFLLPALTVQPLVENAIKHGLMGREEGGTVTITAFETDTHYCVKVADDGVGFDESQPLDERKHVGIRNVRERLQVMCGGSLSVESQPGKGTTALIQIPKEGKKS